MFACRISHCSRAGFSWQKIILKPVLNTWKGQFEVLKLPWPSLQKATLSTKVDYKLFKHLKDQISNKLNKYPAENRSKFSKIVDGLVAGVSIVSIGLLFYVAVAWQYPKTLRWPDAMKQHFRDTYKYFGGGMIFTASSAMLIARSPKLTQLIGGKGWVSLAATLVVAFLSGYMCHSMPYSEGLDAKKLVWMVHNGLLGTFIAPLFVLGGPVMLHAACFGTSIVWGLSAQAIFAQNDAFIIFAGIGMVSSLCLVSSLGPWFLPKLPYRGLRYGMVSVALCGSLAFFGTFLLYEAVKIMDTTMKHPVNGNQSYDPINNSISIYINAVHVMIKIAKFLLQE